MSFFNKLQIEEIVAIGYEAGEIAAASQKSADFQVMQKPDGSSVTSADVEVSKFVNKKLSEKFPEIPVICEEGKLREADDIFWLIDPIDGTGSFIKNSPEFAVNIALVKNKKTIFGLIYAPLFEGGKMVFSNEKDQIIIQNKLEKKAILERKQSVQKGLRIVTSSRTKQIHIDNYIAQFHHEFKNNFSVERLSSAIKFFRILEGDADFYLHFRQSMEWDTAAGQALVELLDGKVKTLVLAENNYLIGRELLYKKADFINEPFISFIW